MSDDFIHQIFGLKICTDILTLKEGDYRDDPRCTDQPYDIFNKSFIDE